MKLIIHLQPIEWEQCGNNEIIHASKRHQEDWNPGLSSVVYGVILLRNRAPFGNSWVTHDMTPFSFSPNVRHSCN